MSGRKRGKQTTTSRSSNHQRGKKTLRGHKWAEGKQEANKLVSPLSPYIAQQSVVLICRVFSRGMLIRHMLISPTDSRHKAYLEMTG